MTELFFLPPPAVGEAKLKGGLILPQGTTFFSYEIVPAFSPSLSLATESLQSQAGTDHSCWHGCEIRLVGSGPLWSARRWRSLSSCCHCYRRHQVSNPRASVVRGDPRVLEEIQPCDKAKALIYLVHLLPAPSGRSWASYLGQVADGKNVLLCWPNSNAIVTREWCTQNRYFNYMPKIVIWHLDMAVSAAHCGSYRCNCFGMISPW